MALLGQSRDRWPSMAFLGHVNKNVKTFRKQKQNQKRKWKLKKENKNENKNENENEN